jgi:hypothetical protein
MVQLMGSSTTASKDVGIMFTQTLRQGYPVRVLLSDFLGCDVIDFIDSDVFGYGFDYSVHCRWW